MNKKLYLFKKSQPKLNWFTSDLKTDLDINIVISRYNENLSWVNDDSFNKYFITCYNKGNNDNFKINSPHQVIKLDNVGKCDHTYLYHIVNNYENLSEYIIFLPGSNDVHYKNLKSKHLINHIEYYKKLVNIGTLIENNIKNKFYNFTMDHYKTTYKNNYELNKIMKTEESKIKPYGKWYEHHFNDININCYTWWGIFAISRDIVYQHPKEYYQKFLDELSNSSNPEVGHYIERSWFAIFHPMNDSIFINHKFNM